MQSDHGVAVVLTGEQLTPAEVLAVARHGAKVSLAPEAWQRIEQASQLVAEFVASPDPVYGVTTGFGSLCATRVAPADALALQENLVLSHAVGAGSPLPSETVRAMMLVRLNAFCSGHSGVRPATAALLLEMLNRYVQAVVPEWGSLGASGDLAPSAHLVLVMLGRGEALLQGQRLSGADALAAVGLEPVTLGPKEGLALLNGTQLMAGAGALALEDAYTLLDTADLAGALSLEGLRCTLTPFDKRVAAIRPYPGHITCAANVRWAAAHSAIVASHEHCDKVQDSYSVRCIPQVHGASRDAAAYVAQTLGVELNAATDNPLLFVQDRHSLSAGNFHGQPLALAFDFLGIAMAEMGAISERRINRLLNSALSGLPPFLTRHSGLHSGYMMAQYTAAALVSENKRLAVPASIDSIPVSADQEDHVSMGWHAVRKCGLIIDNVARILAVELLCAAQAVDLLAPLTPGHGSVAVHQAIRATVDQLTVDRLLAPEMETVYQLVRSGQIAAILPRLPQTQ